MAIELRKVSLRVGAKTHIYETDLKLEPGRFNILLGTTLSGKTSLMRTLTRDVGFGTVSDHPSTTRHVEGAALLVNTTSLGMVGKPPLDLEIEGIDPGTIVTDLVYTPLETDLLKKAAALGCSTVDGVGMLLHQAAPGFSRWFGKDPVVDQDLRNAVLG